MRNARHLPAQLANLASLLVPGAPADRAIAPLDPRLVHDYVVHVGGDPAAYRDTVPAHLFPQWGLALAARTLRGLPYPLARVINAGCRLEIAHPLPARRELLACAHLVSSTDDGRRAVLVHRIATGTADAPDAVVATVRAVIPLAPRSGVRARVEVPYDATEIARWQLDGGAGLAFAMLTGDLNPIHWSTRAARAAGFGGRILHGFAMFARAIEGVVRNRFAGAHARVRTWDALFTRPLRLPADVALFVRDDAAWLGDAHGGSAYLAMTFEREVQS